MSLFIICIAILCVFVHRIQSGNICYNASLPYKTEDNSNCANFNDICVKKNDAQCTNFQSICSQCPPSNYVAIMLQHMSNTIDKKVDGRLNNMMEMLKNLDTKGDRRLNNMMEMLKNLGEMKKIIEINEKRSRTLYIFCVVLIAMFCIMLFVLILENRFKLITKLSECVCKRDGSKYKLLKSRKNLATRDDTVKILEDMERLLKGCTLSDMVILKVEKDNVPLFLQMSRSQTIGELKAIVSRFFNVQNFVLYKEPKILEDIDTIDNCDLKDNDAIKIIIRKTEPLKIKSVFNENDSMSIEYANTDKVSLIVKEIARKFSSQSENFSLLQVDKHLPEDKYLFECDVNGNTDLYYYCLMNINDVVIESYPIDNGFISSLYRATYRSRNGKIFIKKYSFNNFKLDKCDKRLLKQVETFQKTKGNPLFVKLLGIYKDKDSVSIEMEDQGEETLSMFLKNHPNIDKIDIYIYRWLSQIMDGLDFLHKNGIIYRNLMPYEILIDENKNLKLNSFCFSKYRSRHAVTSLISETVGQNSECNIYLAPEIRNSTNYDISADIWSLGVILAYIITGGYPEINDDQDYKLPSCESDELKCLVESCIKKDATARPTIQELRQSAFIKKC